MRKSKINHGGTESRRKTRLNKIEIKSKAEVTEEKGGHERAKKIADNNSHKIVANWEEFKE